ncbi:hypothetical protein Micbo1qcDRAFT_166191 [Microdochium bolleyi]|uniref:Uncharacterized protein n=1 Tax=Microdochium bolleyi TaxID=196109 RepID=A0A136IV36_9PEZI|nr:hypothetical protein Micbo1qcDRAFT_166191 [Microdochium bolleyi]
MAHYDTPTGVHASRSTLMQWEYSTRAPHFLQGLFQQNLSSFHNIVFNLHFVTYQVRKTRLHRARFYLLRASHKEMRL